MVSLCKCCYPTHSMKRTYMKKQFKKLIVVLIAGLFLVSNLYESRVVYCDEGSFSSNKGDVNGDGNIAINDLTILIDYLLGNQNLVVNERAADMDGNGIISIMDVTRLIDFLLSFNN